MSYETAFDASYERVINRLVDGEDFFSTFYKRFLSSSPIVQSKFENTNMNLQKKMLKKSFYSLVVFYVSSQADPYLEKIAHSHNSAHLDIHPSLYDLWLECLIATVKDYDPDYSNDIELAWRIVLSTGITFMKFHYSKST